MPVKMYKYTSNRGNVAVGITLVSVPTIEINSWIMHNIYITALKYLAFIEQLNALKRLNVVFMLAIFAFSVSQQNLHTFLLASVYNTPIFPK